MLSALTSLLSGGATGILGSIFSNITDYFEQKRKNNHEIKMRELDLKEMDKEYQHRKEIKAVEVQGETQQASYEHDKRTYTAGMKIKSMWLKIPMVLVDFVRGLIRPGLTLYLLWLVWDTRMEVQAIIEKSGIEALSPEQAIGIYTAIVDMILFLASTSLTWWFGSRPRQNQNKKD